MLSYVSMSVISTVLSLKSDDHVCKHSPTTINMSNGGSLMTWKCSFNIKEDPNHQDFLV